MKNIRHISRISIYILILFAVVASPVSIILPMTAHAADAPANNPTYTLLEPLPSIDNTGQSSPQKEITLNTYIIYAVNLLIAVAAAAAVFMIVWGGLQYMTTDSWGGKTEGRKKATDAVIGLLMVLSTYIILKTVNPALVNVPATLVPPITGMATSSASSIYDQLIGEMSQLDSTAATATANARNAQAAVNDLQNQLNNAQNDYNSAMSSGDFAAMDAAQTKVADLQDKLNTSGANLVVTITDGLMSQEIRKVASDFTNISNGFTNSSYWTGPSNLDVVKTRIKGYEDEINTLLERRYEALSNFPNAIEQKQQVSDKGNYALAQVATMGSIAIQDQYKNDPNASITSVIITDLKNKVNALKFNDPQVSKQAQDLLTQTITTLNAKI